MLRALQAAAIVGICGFCLVFVLIEGFQVKFSLI
jgi:hypothetical protein